MQYSERVKGQIKMICNTLLRAQNRRKSTAGTTLAALRRGSLITMESGHTRRDSQAPTVAPSMAGETIAGDTIVEEETQINKSVAGGDDNNLDIPDLPPAGKWSAPAS